MMPQNLGHVIPLRVTQPELVSFFRVVPRELRAGLGIARKCKVTGKLPKGVIRHRDEPLGLSY